jgi:hypothetical protein
MNNIVNYINSFPSLHALTFIDGNLEKNISLGGKEAENKIDNSKINYEGNDFKNLDLTFCIIKGPNKDHKINILDLDIFDLKNATYNSNTNFPKGFDAVSAGMIKDD